MENVKNSYANQLMVAKNKLLTVHVLLVMMVKFMVQLVVLTKIQEPKNAIFQIDVHQTSIST